MASGDVIDDEEVVKAGAFNGLGKEANGVRISADVMWEPGVEPHGVLRRIRAARCLAGRGGWRGHGRIVLCHDRPRRDVR